MTTKHDLYHLIDELPDWALPDAERLLAPLRSSCDDPVLRAFMSAPIDDEPLTPEDIAAIEEGHQDVVRGDVILWETYLAQRRNGLMLSIDGGAMKRRGLHHSN